MPARPNPILKMVLIGMGGLNLLNKAGHEAIENHAGQNQAQGSSPVVRANYKVYADEPLNPRVSQPQIRGNCLIATINIDIVEPNINIHNNDITEFLLSLYIT